MKDEKGRFVKGNIPWVKGKKLSQETREKMSKAKIGKPKEKPANWKGGKKKHSCGYILIKNWYHPYCDKNGYIHEHRLVLEKHLKRFLLPKEVAHHINGIRDDNRIENLMLFSSSSAHIRFHSNNNKVEKREIICVGVAW